MSYGMRGKIISASLTFLVLMLWMSSHVFAADLETVRHAIKEKGAHWVAEETEFAKLPLQEKKLRLGLIKPSRTGAERVLASEVPLTGLTASFDWSTGGRYADGKNYVTPVRNQRSCGSCWAFATTGALESYTLISSGDSLCNLSSCDLSEQVLVSCGKAGSCSGGYVSQASDYIRDTGLPVESCYPYLASNGTCSNSCPTWNTSTYRIGAWYYVATTSPTATAIKNALYSYGPLATTMDVYEDFYDFYDSGVYSYVSGGYVGGHAILIVGYADNSAYPGGGFFRVKNSWGTGWGEEGFFRIAYSELGSVVQFGDWTIAYQRPAAAPSAPGNLAATAVNSSRIDLSWIDNADNENGFRIERCAGAGCSVLSPVATVGANVTAYSNMGLLANTAYKYQVLAYNTGGDSGYSNVATAITPALPAVPAAPSGLTATTVSKYSIRLTWSGNATNEEGFKIERCTGSGCTKFSQIATVPANTTTYLNTGLRKATAYTYRVRAYNAGGDSTYSNLAASTTTR